jgi:hypothetical protein
MILKTSITCKNVLFLKGMGNYRKKGRGDREKIRESERLREPHGENRVDASYKWHKVGLTYFALA